MKKNFMLILLALLCSYLSHGQYTLPQNKVWAMGYHSGVSFASGNPVPIATNISSFEGCASVCDSLGTLLFYTDGNTIWRGATGAVMPYGNVIAGGSNNTSSTTQGALIVPDPGNYNRYYVFSLAANPVSKLYCNIVDMSLFGGAGALDTGYTLRGVMLGDSLSEKMIAIRACDNNVWVLTHSKVDTTFLAYLITPFGLNPSPVVSATGGGFPAQYNFRVMKISPDKSKLVVSGEDRLELFSFDYLSGTVYNPRLLSSVAGGYGGAFSPDGTKFYSAGTQYDLNAANPGATAVNLNVTIVSDMRLAPDGKIYFKSPTENVHTFLGRINNPNAAGFACNIQDSVTALAFPLTGLTYGLPNEVVIAQPGAPILSSVVMDTLICHAPPGGLILHCAGTYRVWDDGSSGTDRAITEPGTYYVFHMSGGCKGALDSFIIRGLIKPVEISYDGNSTLSTTHTYTSYKWYKDGGAIPGGTNASQYISRNGWYAVVVHDQWGCSDSTVFQVTGFTGIAGVDALKKLIRVYPNPATDIVHVQAPFTARLSLYNPEGRLLLQSNGPSVHIGQFPAGLYLLRIEDDKGRLISVEKVSKL